MQTAAIGCNGEHASMFGRSGRGCRVEPGISGPLRVSTKGTVLWARKWRERIRPFSL